LLSWPCEGFSRTRNQLGEVKLLGEGGDRKKKTKIKHHFDNSRKKNFLGRRVQLSTLLDKKSVHGGGETGGVPKGSTMEIYFPQAKKMDKKQKTT